MSVLDRGLAYGDGVFRTFVASSGVPQHWQRQYAKLSDDAMRIGIAVPDAEVLLRDVVKVASGEPACVVKIIVTRGVGERGYASGSPRPTRIIMSAARPTYASEYTQSGVKVRVCNLRLAAQPALAGIKHLNRLENVLARAEWDDRDIAEGILCDRDGNAIGGTMSNVFMMKAGELITPDLSTCGVAGVTRERVIDAARLHRVACRVAAVPLRELVSADEVFVVNSVIGVWPVSAIGSTRLAIGGFTRRVQRWLAGDDHEALA